MTASIASLINIAAIQLEAASEFSGSTWYPSGMEAEFSDFVDEFDAWREELPQRIHDAANADPAYCWRAHGGKQCPKLAYDVSYHPYGDATAAERLCECSAQNIYQCPAVKAAGFSDSPTPAKEKPHG